jgi:ketosteroid isomerase-like protein
MTQRLGGFAGGHLANRQAAVLLRAFVILLIALAIVLVAPGPWAQKKSAKQPKPPLEGQPMPEVPLPVADKIDNNIGEMLGAFQVGDIEAMHKHYADNATFVSGAYEPAIVGWQNYVTGYQRQRAAFQGMQLIRRNTLVFTHGDVAWASYQWEFFANYNDKPYSAHGQTTLVLNKIGDNWLIVHNHTSQVCDARSQAPQQSTAKAPAQNPAAPAAPPSKP